MQPGTKLFVDSKGNFHICKRANATSPVGDVERGLDFKTIKSFISEYLRHSDKCPSCDLRRACSNCYVPFVDNGMFFYSSEICKEVESFYAG
jgi:uncharacterized protein